MMTGVGRGSAVGAAARKAWRERRERWSANWLRVPGMCVMAKWKQ